MAKKKKRSEVIKLRSVTPGMVVEVTRMLGLGGTKKCKERMLIMEIKSSAGREGFTVLHVDSYNHYEGPMWGTFQGDERCKILKGKEEHDFLRSVRSGTLSRLNSVEDHLREVETIMFLKKVHPCIRRERP